ncbi:hypothetical protein B0A55_07776 [Friedmanniomyces simplex]|uniref:Uncharacterized protein n=1 Tax=Friedmanniomyces simplex TaxID=329884 RepID=A0A4U0XAT2_9PEZI|nr:hypothetical protein B0A55_07776 [Friedmanniomyces simplex]
MNAQKVATPFCSSLLVISTVTQTKTATSKPACQTITSSVDSTATVTTVSTSVVYGVTTVYPVVAISTTSTCALGTTVVPAAGTGKVKRGNDWPQTSTAIGTPKCLTASQGGALTSACSCLSIPTPTSVSITTTTLPVNTITQTIASTASITLTSLLTSTSWTCTYSATQFHISTFTLLPAPTSILALPDGETYGIYPNLDFAGQDIQDFFCYAGGPAPPTPYPSCASFSDCVAVCAYFNVNDLGGATNTSCGTVVNNAPADGSSGSCYLKTGQTGCGSLNGMMDTGVLLPLVPND